MIPWIQVYSNILTHDKTYTLAEALKVPNYSAVGLMVSLWCWVAVNAPDGDITRYPPRAITEATGWTKKPETFYNALVNAGLIEKTEDGRAVIRNWEQYAMLLIDLMSVRKRKRLSVSKSTGNARSSGSRLATILHRRKKRHL